MIDEIITKRYALDRMHYKVFSLKQVVQTGPLPAERLDMSFEQQLVKKGLEKENLHSDNEEKHPAVGIVKH